MTQDVSSSTGTRIIKKAIDLGASSAGIASVARLRQSPSYQQYHKVPYYTNYQGVQWPSDAKSVLVLALFHPPSEPQLDWWGDIRGKTLGNQCLIDLAENLEKWINSHIGIKAHPLPYQIEQGGILLKDSAVLAGMGVIGKNNLLITPEFGPRVRLRGLFLDADIEPTGPLDFDPCGGCDMPCRRVCPQKAFIEGSYSRHRCDQQIDQDAKNRKIVEKWIQEELTSEVVKYCRLCELACPIPRQSQKGF